MELILSNPTERELIRARKDAENDWRTIVNAAEQRGAQNATIATLAELVRRNRLTIAEAAEEANMSVEEFTERMATPVAQS